MNRIFALVGIVLGFLARPLLAQSPTFEGEWDTTYGRMVLVAQGNKLTGTYAAPGEIANDISGTRDGNRFVFTYKEPGVTGEGSFTLSPDNSSFDGQWRPLGTEGWASWSGRRPAKENRDFSGVWKTSYGMMRLTQKGNMVEGCYAFTGRATVTGEVKNGSLSLKYREPDGTTGVAEFKLSEDRSRFAGTWRVDAGSGGGAWTGERVEPQAGRIWLIILERRWENSLRDQEYSYGEMLRQFFTRVSSVAVRHRFFTGRADFAHWCEELPYINEPVILYVSSHGTEKGISAHNDVLDGTFIGTQLREASSLKLVHLGACLAMKGTVPQDIKAAGQLATPISGYTRTADWAGSAVIDFAYLDLVLARQLSPREAVKQIRDNVAFAAEEGKPGSVIAPAGLKLVE